MGRFVFHPDFAFVMTARQPAPAFEQKICDSADVEARVRALPRPLVFTNGVFDILHRGHATYLAQARALGASLVVGVNTDASVRMLGKGDDRPLNTQDDRLAVLAARIQDVQQRARQQKEAAERKSLIGSGDRSERIRTYNFPQGRVTDHRINLTLYRLDAVMDGDLAELTDALTAEHQAELLAQLAGD